MVENVGCVARNSVEGSGALGDGDGDRLPFVSFGYQPTERPTVCFTNPGLGAKWEPIYENGAQIGGTLISKVLFDGGAGHMLCKGQKEPGSTEEITFAAAYTGQIKPFTYEGQESIDAH
jgi:hypothetical protein